MDGARYSTAQRRPGRAVPHGDAAGADFADVRKAPPGVEVPRLIEHQGFDEEASVWSTRTAEGSPFCAIPSRNDEAASAVKVVVCGRVHAARVIHSKRAGDIKLAAHTVAKRRPRCAIPSGDVVGAYSTGSCEVASCVDIAGLVDC